MVYIKRIDPTNFTYEQALQFGEVSAITFDRSPLSVYTSDISKANWIYETHNELYTNHPDLDANSRLDLLVKRSADLRSISHAMARLALVQSVTPGLDMYAAVETIGDNKNGERIVGATVWEYPKHMVPQLEEALGRTGWKWTVYSLWVKLKCSIQELLAWRGTPHPYLNLRFAKFVEEATQVLENDNASEDQLVEMDDAEIQKAVYPPPYLLTCQLFGIVPYYQRKGIGQMLMNQSLQNIPNVPIPVTGVVGTAAGGGAKEHKTVYLPQKAQVESSEEGFGMYSKCGFTTHIHHEFKLDGYTVPVTHMILHGRELNN